MHSNGINILLVKQGVSPLVYKNQARGSLSGEDFWQSTWSWSDVKVEDHCIIDNAGR